MAPLDDMLHNSVAPTVAMEEDSAHVPMWEESTCLMDKRGHYSSSICAEWSPAKWKLSVHQAESSILKSLYCGESNGKDDSASMDVLQETHWKSDADDCRVGLREVDEHRILTRPKERARDVVAGTLVTALLEIVVARCFAKGKLYRKRLACHGDREELGNQVLARRPANGLVDIPGCGNRASQTGVMSLLRQSASLADAAASSKSSHLLPNNPLGSIEPDLISEPRENRLENSLSPSRSCLLCLA